MRNKFAKFAALAVCAGFASCSEYDAGIDPMSSYEIAYEAAFIKTFGQPAADQDWGFGSKETRGANVNANEWGASWDCVPNVDLTPEELEELKALLSPGVPTYNTEIFPYENYWVSQVYKGEDTYYGIDHCESNNNCQLNGGCDHVKSGDHTTNSSVTGSQQMDKLVAWNGSDYDHINNFNNGNNTENVYDQNFTDPNTGSHNHEGTTLMTNMPTSNIDPNEQFGFIDSYGSKVYCNYYIVYYKGYWYVGFDFEAHKTSDTNNHDENMDVERDWNFTDWIVRITPAYAKGTTPETPGDGDGDGDNEDDGGDEGDFLPLCRVIAEDLSASNSSDFDFNDIVFDVKCSDTQTQVILQAAGGTLPLYVKVDGKEVEVHSAFQVGTGTMVNTNNGTATRESVVLFTLDRVLTKQDVKNDIEIWVQKEDGNSYELTAEQGVPACKICVNPDFEWCDERQPMEEKYPLFGKWVKDPGVEWEYTNQ